MSYSPKPRVAVDLDEIARQLNQPGPSSAQRRDNLAELAQIPGQDDPYGRMLAPELAVRAVPVPEAPPRDIAFPPAAQRAVDEDAYAAEVAEEAYDDTYPNEDQEDLVPLKPRRSRKGLMAVAGVLGAAVVGVGGALVFGGGKGFVPAGEPPVIAAAQGPVKVKPEAPGGVEIPNQNKQIYERAVPEGQTKVVNREEQAVDIRPPTRVASTHPELLVSTAPPAHNAIGTTLGEPRRVRTVSIRPDGSVISDASPSALALPAPAATPPRPATAAAPTALPAPQAAAPTPAPAPAASTPVTATPARPVPAASTPAPSPATPAAVAQPSTPAPQAAAQTPAPQPRAPATTASTPAPVPAATPTRPAATAAATPAATPTPAAATPAQPTRVAAVQQPAPAATAEGGWTVQLGVRSSEADAKAAFGQFQQKYAALAGKPALIRQAEVNGNTIYRVRVGPLDKDEASSLCSKLQGAGGQCFVAKN